MQLSNPRAKSATPDRLWSQRREASLSWLAFGLLLAAWNTAEDDAGRSRPRPPSLRGYWCGSVRAVARSEALHR